MKLPQQLRILELMGHVSSLAKTVHVRLALSRENGDQWVARSLVVDVFPDIWLDHPDDMFTEYDPPRFLHNYPGQALFVGGFIPTEVVASWFGDPQESELRNFDQRLGMRSRIVRFRMPELQESTSSYHLNSWTDDGFALLPWPHFDFRCEVKAGNVYRQSDQQALYVPGQRHFDNFREARLLLIRAGGSSRYVYRDQDEVEIRLVDGDGWIRRVRVWGRKLNSFDVEVGGLRLRQGQVILKGEGLYEPRDVSAPAMVTFALESDPPGQVTAVLANETGELDRAMYVPVPTAIYGSSTLQVVVEGEVESESSDMLTADQDAPAPDRRMQDEPPPPSPPLGAASLLTSQQRIPPTAQRPTTPRVLRIVVASPGDVKKERGSLPDVLDELNEALAGHLGLRLELWRWETDAFPDFHVNGPQGQVDQLMRIEDADIVIGIFWNRFGTPVADAKSGTEHELLRAYEAWKEHLRPHIMVYFNEHPYRPKNQSESEQLHAVLAFKDQFPQKGLWWAYPNGSKFPGLVRRHLSRLLLEYYTPSD